MRPLGQGKLMMGCAVPKNSSRVIDLRSARQNSSGPTPAEGLELVRAFLKIEDASRRQAIVQWVEFIAAGEETAAPGKSSFIQP